MKPLWRNWRRILSPIPIWSILNVQNPDRFLAVTTDMTQMNQLKSSILQRVQEQLGEHLDTGVPLGTLLGSELLHGRGPNIPVRLTLSGNVTADFESTFESAGINQTKHRICLHIFIPVFIRFCRLLTMAQPRLKPTYLWQKP